MEYKRDIKQRTFEFSLAVIGLLEDLPRTYIYQILGKQLLRSATSIGANVIEAQAGSSLKDFMNFYFIGLKSANETIYWLKLVKAKSNNLIVNRINDLLNESIEISKILGASLVTMRRKTQSKNLKGKG